MRRYLRRLIKDYQVHIFFGILALSAIIFTYLFLTKLSAIGVIISFIVLSIVVLSAISIFGSYELKTSLMMSLGMKTVLCVTDYTNFHQCDELCQEEEGHTRFHCPSYQYFLNAEVAAEENGHNIDEINRQLVTNTPDEFPDSYHRVSIKKVFPIWIVEVVVPNFFLKTLKLLFFAFLVLLGVLIFPKELVIELWTELWKLWPS